MNLLAISGSARRASTNTALLRALANLPNTPVKITLFDGLQTLPIFSPDLEGPQTPPEIITFANAVKNADGLVISCPEYVHALPGGFKNAIDWLVSRDEIIGKPIVHLHASHRGEDVLSSLRLVLETVSENFMPDIFERFQLRGKSPAEITEFLSQPDEQSRLYDFLTRFTDAIRRGD